jgi:aminoglycoside N3'-acetyltransferase
MSKIKIDGLDVAIEKLALRSNDLVILSGDLYTPNQVIAFRHQLFEAAPLDLKILGVVALQGDQRIETINIKDGDTVVVHGAISDAQFEVFQKDIMTRHPGVRGVERMPAGVTVEVHQRNKWPLE